MFSRKKIIICISFFAIFFITLAIVVISLEKFQKTTYAIDEEKQEVSLNQDEKDLQISTAKKIDIDKIIEENSNSYKYKEEIVIEEEELEYITKYRNNSDIYIGQTEVSQEGRNGTQAITIKKTYDENGELINEEKMSAVVVKSSINKIIDIGTKKYTQPEVTSANGELDFNMDLRRPSGFTLEQFTVALTDDKDKYNTFQDNAKYFYYVEEQYNINGMFVAALGIHESGWGTSAIARNKYNLFGYGAYDSNPYNGAYTFEDYAESIDLVSRVLVKYYLNPKGTKIYDNGTANGSYYNGSTLSAVNQKYASDKQWANKVYSHMQYLYNKIKKN